jgi:hypothetical protein
MKRIVALGVTSGRQISTRLVPCNYFAASSAQFATFAGKSGEDQRKEDIGKVGDVNRMPSAGGAQDSMSKQDWQRDTQAKDSQSQRDSQWQRDAKQNDNQAQRDSQWQRDSQAQRESKQNDYQAPKKSDTSSTSQERVEQGKRQAEQQPRDSQGRFKSTH